MTLPKTSFTSQKIISLWNQILHFLTLVSVAKVSIVTTLFLFFIFFKVDQFTDAMIALCENNIIFKLLFLLASLLISFQMWYGAKVEYRTMIAVSHNKQHRLIDLHIANDLPRVIGITTFTILLVAYFQTLQIVNHSKETMVTALLFTITWMGFVGVILLHRRADFDKLSKRIPINTKYLNIMTAISVLVLFAFLIDPIHSTEWIGSSVTAAILCVSIWLPFLFRIQKLSQQTGLPILAAIIVIAFVFSFFNNNKSVRILDRTNIDARLNMTSYMDQWVRNKVNNDSSILEADRTIPMIFVLSEGGGIRAAYWSAGMMGSIQDSIPQFSSYLFGISGVSGGSLGASVFSSLTAETFKHENPQDDVYASRAKEMLGQDLLTPVISAMLTRGIVQLFVPFPIDAFDYAKICEKTWEHAWMDAVHESSNIDEKNLFSQSFTEMTMPDSLFRVPPPFINATIVENGMPILVSPYTIEKDSVLTDFHQLITPQSDVRVSTAALLSARFPYIGPAGIIENEHFQKNGVVDGGYFDNSGANAVHKIIASLYPEMLQLNKNLNITIKPIVIYLRNGLEQKQENYFHGNQLYQLAAPFTTLSQCRSAHSENSISKLRKDLELINGEFLVCNLNTKHDSIRLPLGWALSKDAQLEIDHQIDLKSKELIDSLANIDDLFSSPRGNQSFLLSL